MNEETALQRSTAALVSRAASALPAGAPHCMHPRYPVRTCTSSLHLSSSCKACVFLFRNPPLSPAASGQMHQVASTHESSCSQAHVRRAWRLTPAHIDAPVDAFLPCLPPLRGPVSVGTRALFGPVKPCCLHSRSVRARSHPGVGCMTHRLYKACGTWATSVQVNARAPQIGWLTAHTQAIQPSHMRAKLSALVAAAISRCTSSATSAASPLLAAPRAAASPAAVLAPWPCSLARKLCSTEAAYCRRSAASCCGGRAVSSKLPLSALPPLALLLLLLSEESGLPPGDVPPCLSSSCSNPRKLKPCRLCRAAAWLPAWEARPCRLAGRSASHCCSCSTCSSCKSQLVEGQGVGCSCRHQVQSHYHAPHRNNTRPRH